jgi:glycine/D-amino acid oxidase-like deaminating enzyme
MSAARHVIVVGAGIVGAAVAEALAVDGNRVTVIDRGVPVCGATAAAMGHVVAMDEAEPWLTLTTMSRQMWHARLPELPAAVDHSRCGTIWLARDDEENKEAESKHRRLTSYGVRAELLDPHSLYEAEPGLRRGLVGGLLVPDDATIYPAAATLTMLRRVRALGGKVLHRETVTSMSGTELRLASGRRLTCDYAVNATGAAAAKLVSDCGVRARKGQLIATNRYAGLVKHQLIELSYTRSAHVDHDLDAPAVAFNVQPRPTGELLIGSCRYYGDETPWVDFKILARMVNRAVEYLPALSSLAFNRVWTGLRAASPDGLPLIGPHPDDPNLILATGHEGLGITTSLATAKLISDYLANRAGVIPLEPYLPARLSRCVGRASSDQADSSCITLVDAI